MRVSHIDSSNRGTPREAFESLRGTHQALRSLYRLSKESRGHGQRQKKHFRIPRLRPGNRTLRNNSARHERFVRYEERPKNHKRAKEQSPGAPARSHEESPVSPDQIPRRYPEKITTETTCGALVVAQAARRIRSSNIRGNSALA